MLIALDRVHDALGRLDVLATDDRFEVLMDVPGVRIEDLELEALGDELTVRGLRRHVHDPDGHATHRFQRRLRLAGEIDADQVTADLQHGVLRILVPRGATGVTRIPVGAPRRVGHLRHRQERVRLPWRRPDTQARRRLRRGARRLLDRHSRA